MPVYPTSENTYEPGPDGPQLNSENDLEKMRPAIGEDVANLISERQPDIAHNKYLKITPMEWINCKDRLPEEDQRTLIFVPDNPVFLNSDDSTRSVVCIGRFSKNEVYGNDHLPYHWKDSPGYFFGHKVTHWMPLPEPPK